LRVSEARCDSTFQMKPERGVSEIARDMKKNFTSRWHEQDLNMALLLRAWQTSCEAKCNIYTLSARSCMVFWRSVVNVELRLSRAWKHVVLRVSEARCDSTFQMKPERGVSKIARDMKKNFTSRWHEQDLNMALLLRAWQTSCEAKCNIYTLSARSCMYFTLFA